MLEVKATTTGEVRLTPAQAVRASDDPDHFILCVVDLRGITHEQMEADWTAAQVEPKTKIVVGIGLLANHTRDWSPRRNSPKSAFATTPPCGTASRPKSGRQDSQSPMGSKSQTAVESNTTTRQTTSQATASTPNPPMES